MYKLDMNMILLLKQEPILLTDFVTTSNKDNAVVVFIDCNTS